MGLGGLRRTLLYSLAALCLVVTLSAETFAWGDKGHRIVARVAAQGLTAAARGAVGNLLGDDAFLADCQQHHIPTATFQDKLACFATWADKVRNDRTYTRQWHFVDIPRNAAQYAAARDCVAGVEGDCVIQEIERAFAVLSNSGEERCARAAALKYIIHFIGDMHQPLHGATDTQDGEAIANGFQTDRGGNLKFVTWMGSPTNSFGDNWQLHAVWDSGIIDKMLEDQSADEASLANALVAALTPAQKQFASPSTVPLPKFAESLDGFLTQWAQDAHALAVQKAYGGLGPQDANDVAVDKGKSYHRYHLTQAYLNSNRPVVRQQLAFAGVRLARVLNEALR
jgi:hypothetical protein